MNSRSAAVRWRLHDRAAELNPGADDKVPEVPPAAAVAPAPDSHDGGLSDPAPRPGARRSHRLPGLVLEDQPGAALRRDALTRGQVSFFHTSTTASSRSIARRAGCCHDQPYRRSNRHLPSTVYDTWNNRLISVFTRASVHRWSAQPWTSGLAPLPFQSGDLGRTEPRAARRSLRQQPVSPRSSQVRRHRSTDRSLTRSAAAICRFFSLPSKRSTASSRIRSRTALSASVSPPPCAYLTGTRATGTGPPLSGERFRHHSFKLSSK